MRAGKESWHANNAGRHRMRAGMERTRMGRAGIILGHQAWDGGKYWSGKGVGQGVQSYGDGRHRTRAGSHMAKAGMDVGTHRTWAGINLDKNKPGPGINVDRHKRRQARLQAVENAGTRKCRQA
jgi:hypothetical protein